MAKRPPTTAATRVLDAARVDYTPRLYTYVERGGTRASAHALGLDEHHVVKTLVMRDDQRRPLVVLMHGDQSVSTKDLARALGVKAIEPCDPKTAQKHSGYQVGGTSPFGLRHAMPIYCEESILSLDRIAINGGKRGFLVEIAPAVLRDVLDVTPVSVAR